MKIKIRLYKEIMSWFTQESKIYERIKKIDDNETVDAIKSPLAIYKGKIVDIYI